MSMEIESLLSLMGMDRVAGGCQLPLLPEGPVISSQYLWLYTTVVAGTYEIL